MDYKKKYNEALERARELHGTVAAGRDFLAEIFPELRESEDERIIKTLQEYVKNRNWMLNGPTQDEVFAWLEKQKECVADSSKTLADEDERIRAVILKLVLGMRDEIFTTADKLVTKPKVLDWLKKQKEQKSKDDEQKWLDGIKRDWFERGKKEVLTVPELYGLEKQKEQKPELVQQPPITYTYPSDASRDERLKAALLALLNSDLLKVKEGGYFTKQDLIEWVEHIEQKPADLSEMMVHKEPYIAPVPTPMVADEQKPAKPSGKLSRQDYLYQLLIDQLITYSDYEYLIGQKPAEWSEKDEFILEDAITAVDMHLTNEFKRDCPTLFAAFMAAKDWLKSLPERFVLEPKQEWGEKDEKIRNAILGFLNPDKGGTKYSSNAELFEWSNWLKSLRPQPHWKPSEEQMNALNFAITYFMHETSYKNPTELRDLYEQLKKL